MCTRAWLALHAVGGWVGIFVAASCGGSGPEVGTAPLVADRAIVNGTPSSEPAVVALRIPALGGSCSGTLITPTIVLTAAHCLDLGIALRSEADVFFGASDSGPGQSRAIVRAQVHPNWGTDWNDYGFVEMESAAPATVTPIPYLPANLGLSAADSGAAVLFAGYGIDENGHYGTRLEVPGVIDQLCLGASFCGYLAPHSFSYPQVPGGPCHGDSGGPAFVDRGGTRYLAGITSYGDGEHDDCSDSTYGVSMIVDAQAGLIDAFIAGSDVGPSMLDGGNGGGPMNYACLDPSACAPGSACTPAVGCPAGGYCYDDGMNGFCYYECNVDADCGSGNVCWLYQGAGTCFASCSSDADCRTHYSCEEVGLSTPVCYPVPGVSGCTEPSCAPGAPCTRDSDCPGGQCESLVDGFVGGYCSYYCAQDSDCGEGAVCRTLSGMCFATCASPSDCRAGYDCVGVGGAEDVCYPQGGSGASPIGGACLEHDDCAGGRCWSEADFGLTGGFCFDVCTDTSDCPTGAICGPSSYCYHACQWQEDCRAGYTCTPFPDDPAQGFCWVGCREGHQCDVGESCNDWDLCGERTPPRTDPKPAPANPVTSVRRPKKAKGCEAVDPSELASLLVALMALRRRRGGARHTRVTG